MSADQTILIIGAGQAGGQLARQLLAGGHPGPVIIASAETHSPYERPPLSKAVLKGEGEGALAILSAEEVTDPRLAFRGGDPVVALDATQKRARLTSGDEISYDACVFATGGDARPLTLPGGDLCQTLRTLDDSRRLRAQLTPDRRLVIIGGGVIGMEVAATAATLGCRVTVVEMGPRVMARILPPVLSDWLAGLHGQAGVEVLHGVRPASISKTPDGFEVDGTDADGAAFVLQADIVLSAIGIIPCAALLPQSFHGPSGGILTDACGRVPDLDGVFAAGDVAESWNPVYQRPLRLETWRNADRQARAIARTLCGTDTPHSETPWMWTDQLDRNIQVVGLWQEGAEVICRGQPGSPGSSVYWLRDGVLIGGALIDAGRERRFLEKLVETGARPDPRALADPAVPLKSL